MEPAGYEPFSLLQTWEYHEHLNSANSQLPAQSLTEAEMEAWFNSILANRDHASQSQNPTPYASVNLQTTEERRAQELPQRIASTFLPSPASPPSSPGISARVESPSTTSSFKRRVQGIYAKHSAHVQMAKKRRAQNKLKGHLAQMRRKADLHQKDLQTMTRTEDMCQLYLQGFPSSQGINLQGPPNLESLPPQKQEELKIAACKSDLPRLFEGVVLEAICRLDETQSREAALQERISKLEQENQRVKNMLNGWTLLFPSQ